LPSEIQRISEIYEADILKNNKFNEKFLKLIDQLSEENSKKLSTFVQLF
jgi:hypothetical protein